LIRWKCYFVEIMETRPTGLAAGLYCGLWIARNCGPPRVKAKVTRSVPSGAVIRAIQISVVVENHVIRRVTADAPEYAQVRPVGREFPDKITSIVPDIRVTSVSMTIPDGT